MTRAVGFSAGAVAFFAAHAIEVARWSAWFGGAHQPWFLNTAAATGFTLACVLVAGGAVAMLEGSSRPARGVSVAVGSGAAMTLVLFLKEGGPGSIFPLVLVAGWALLLASAALGAWIGWEVRGALPRR